MDLRKMIVCAAALLAGCGESSICNDASVLKTLQEVYERDMFGPMVKPIPGVFTVQADSSTFVSKNKETGETRCKVLIKTDYIKSTGRPLSEDELSRIRDNAVKNNTPLIKEEMVAYLVERLGSSKFYVTLAP